VTTPTTPSAITQYPYGPSPVIEEELATSSVSSVNDTGSTLQANWPSPEAIQREVAVVSRTELGSDLSHWVEKYNRVGDRNPYLWQWCCRGVEITTLPCIQPDMRREVRDTKVLGVMFDVLIDDVADQQGDMVLLEHMLELPYGRPRSSLSQFSSDEQEYVRFTAEVWGEIQRRVGRYVLFDEYSDLLRFDYLQLLNTMRYAHLLNGNPALLNLAEHDLYLPHNMHMMVSATIDLMCSPNFDAFELGILREAVWHAQCMGRIGNLVTTWQRELGEGDYTSGVFARALSYGHITVQDLLAGDRQWIEAAIQGGRHEDGFREEWSTHRRHLQGLVQRLKSVDLGQLIGGLDRLICLHLGSRGNK
jgi:hypothetical protein